MDQLPGHEAPPPPFNARAALSLPSILLMVVGAFGVLGGLANVALYASGGRLLEPLVKMARDLQPGLRDALQSEMHPGAGSWAMALLALAASALVIYGALQMRGLKSWGLSLAACIVAMIPCFSSCCCVIGLPVGIWAIVILNKPEVKAQFT